MLTREQLRDAVFEVFSGRIPRDLGIEYDNFNSLKIGVRKALAQAGILEPQGPGQFPADWALQKPDELELWAVFQEFVANGVIRQSPDARTFAVSIVPNPFGASWQFLQNLRGGGQSRTIKIRSLSSQTLGVLKLPESTGDTATKRFKREVSIVQRINHPAIMRILDSNLDETRGDLGYVTPFGTPLDQYWSALSPTLSPENRYDRAYAIMKQICLGLSLVHDQGVVHRDLKPENVVMLGDQPVIIDFGVAIGPADERLTKIEGRLVANRSTTPPAAHYGLQPNSPAWDSYSLACIYGYLAGSIPEAKQFHWRFHQLVSEKRDNRLRTLLAIASGTEGVPANAREFLNEMDRWQLSGAIAPVESGSPISRVAAETAFLEAQAERKQFELAEKEQQEIEIQVIGPLVDDIRSLMKRECIGTSTMPIKQYPFPHQWITPERPIGGIMQEAFERRRQSMAPNGDVSMQFFSCFCGPQPRQFFITADLYYRAKVEGSSSRYTFNLRCQLREARPELQNEVRQFSIGTNGSIWDSKTGASCQPQEIARVVIDWTADPRFWRAIAL